jgi:molecular chaperone GrpE
MSERTQDEGTATGAADAAPVEADATEAEVIEDEQVVDAEVIEDEEGTDAEGESGDEVAAELDELAQAQRERDSYLELAQRARADFENYRRRVANQSADAERRGKVSVAQGLLPALDNLERALAASGVDLEPPEEPEEPLSAEVSARDALASGVALVLNELRGALERSGVVSYDPAGERFDPTLHEAISTGEANGAESGTVIETLQRGYRVDDQVIRPARVVVAG